MATYTNYDQNLRRWLFDQKIPPSMRQGPPVSSLNYPTKVRTHVTRNKKAKNVYRVKNRNGVMIYVVKGRLQAPPATPRRGLLSHWVTNVLQYF